MTIPVPKIDGIDAVFGGSAMDILPPMDKIPPQFKPTGSCTVNGKTTYSCTKGHPAASKWLAMFDDWFFCGLKNVKWTPKEGVDVADALRAISCCMSSWAPSHEHKHAGVAYLLSEWFEDAVYEKGGG